MKIYCNVCNKYNLSIYLFIYLSIYLSIYTYITFNNPKTSKIFKKLLGLYLVCSKCSHEHKKYKEEKSIQILKILGLITNIEEYQKIYNHV